MTSTEAIRSPVTDDVTGSTVVIEQPQSQPMSAFPISTSEIQNGGANETFANGGPDTGKAECYDVIVDTTGMAVAVDDFTSPPPLDQGNKKGNQQSSALHNSGTNYYCCYGCGTDGGCGSCGGCGDGSCCCGDGSCDGCGDGCDSVGEFCHDAICFPLQCCCDLCCGVSSAGGDAISGACCDGCGGCVGDCCGAVDCGGCDCAIC